MAIESAQAIACDELVIKRGCAPTFVLDRKAGPGWAAVPTERVGRVIDTTAAGMLSRRDISPAGLPASGPSTPRRSAIVWPPE
ncbi:MAG TPA: hypothetical protein VIN06_04280 [Devosia sp.]